MQLLSILSMVVKLTNCLENIIRASFVDTMPTSGRGNKPKTATRDSKKTNNKSVAKYQNDKF